MNRRLLPLGFLLLCMVIGLFYVNQSPNKPSLSTTETISETSKTKFKGTKVSKETRIDKAFQQDFDKTKDLSSNTIPKERLLIAQQRVNQLKSSRAPISGVTWNERGPSNVGGRTRAVLFDANDNTGNTVLAAGVAGGVWRTANFKAASPTWTQVNDFMDNLAVTCIFQDPSNLNTIYIGTGEGYFNGGAVRGLGIFRSTNAGASFSQMASTNNSDFHYVQDFIIDGSGNFYAATRNRGVQRSTNSGTSWTQVLGSSIGIGTTNRASDLELGSDGDIYASLGIFSTGTVWRSTTGAAGSWTDISPTGAFNRIEIATAPSDADKIYVLCQGDGSNDVTGIFSSNDKGANWTSRPIPTIIDQGSNSIFTRSQAWYDLICVVDPNNANTIYIGGIDALRSTDQGANWTQISTWALFGATGYTVAQNVHADQHMIVFEPGSSTNAVWGTDGGLHFTTNANSSPAFPSWTSKNTGYNVTQFYACAIHPSAGQDFYLAGAQDNGSHRFTATGINSTTEVSGGDGAFCHIDQDNPNIQITSYVFNNYYISTNGGASFNNAGVGGNTGGFINPTDYDNDSNILYGGNAAGTYFRWNNPGVGTSENNVSVSSFAGATVTHVAADPNTANRIYFGLNNGSIVRIDGANTGTTQTGTVLNPGSTGSVSSVAIEEGNPNHLLATYSNYGMVSVYESTNAGASWTNIENDLPDMPIRWAIFAPCNNDQVLLATELGVWSTDNINGASTSWSPTNGGLANVRVDMLQYRTSDNQVVAATHGRGLFSSNFCERPSFSFQTATSTENELYTADGCNFRTVNVPVEVTGTLIDDVTITISVDAASTATAAQDYDLNPATLTKLFRTTDAPPYIHNVEVRIYDDATEEGLTNELLLLNVGLSSGTANNGTNIQHRMDFVDDDSNPTLAGAGIPQVIWSDDFEDGNTTDWTLSSEAGNAANRWGNFNVACTPQINNFTLQIFNNTNTAAPACSYNNASPQTGAYAYRTVNATGLSNLSVEFNWKCLAEATFDFGKLVYSTNTVVPSWTELPTEYSGQSATQSANVSLPAALNGTTFLLGWKWQNDNNTGSNPPLGIDDIFVRGSAEPDIESLTAATTKSAFIGANHTTHFYSPNGEIYASIKNNSASPIGCVNVTVDRQAASANTSSVAQTEAWINNDDISQKTFLVTAPAGTYDYDITLYYDTAEIDETMFDQSSTSPRRNGLSVVKSDVGIPLVTTANAVPNNTTILAATINNYSTGKVAYTVAGLSTFSGFALTDAVIIVPVELLDFSGKMVGNRKVQLDWTTASEVNNAGFDIEKSLDGQSFRRIGHVKGNGTTSTTTNYTLDDNNIQAATQYYRLKQIDLDGTYEYSEIITINSARRVAKFFDVTPNPMDTYININLMDKINDRLVLDLYDITGKKVAQLFDGIPNGGQIKVDLINTRLSSGVYFVRGYIPTQDKMYSLRIVKM